MLDHRCVFSEASFAVNLDLVGDIQSSGEIEWEHQVIKLLSAKIEVSSTFLHYYVIPFFTFF